MKGRLSLSTVFTGLAILTSGCSDPLPPESSFENCRADEGIVVCIARDRYAAGSRVAFTVANNTGQELFLDRCSGQVEGRPGPGGNWSTSFGYSRSCPAAPGSEEVRAAMTALPRGNPIADTLLTNDRAHSGEWRLAVWILTSDGLPLRTEPFVSPRFSLE